MQLRKIGCVLLGACLLAALSCGRREEDSKKIDDIVARLDRIEKKMEAKPAFPPRPPEPDTKTVYSVPIEGDPFVGTPAAKVTIVEASDFA